MNFFLNLSLLKLPDSTLYLSMLYLRKIELGATNAAPGNILVPCRDKFMDD